MAERPMARRRTAAAWTGDPCDVRPMLATPAAPGAHERLLRNPELVFEPKYDGIRALVSLDAPERPVIRTRLGRDKTGQFPDLVEPLAALGRRLRRPALLDGEIVATDAAGEALAFECLQERLHVTGAAVAAAARRVAAALVVFDLLRDGGEDLRPLPFTERRRRLERLLRRAGSHAVRLVDSNVGNGVALAAHARERNWEGIIVKRPDARYASGSRGTDWRKLKFIRGEEFVIGGWTLPRGSRRHFGALLLGYYPAGVRRSEREPLVFAGQVGTGFTDAELERLAGLLAPLAADAPPFVELAPPKPSEKRRWVEPVLVAQTSFSRWTPDGVLRHPVYLGLRDDKRPAEVRLPRRRPPPGRASEPAERRAGTRTGTTRRPAATVDPPHPGARTPPAKHPVPGAPAAAADPPHPGARTPPATRSVPGASAATKTGTPPADRPARRRSAAPQRRAAQPAHPEPARGSRPTPGTAPQRRAVQPAHPEPAVDDLLERLEALERDRRRGVLVLRDGARLPAGNLHKVFWPGPGVTKGELVRFYLRVAPYLLPVVADRPLVMKRFPNGVEGKSFYQHRAPEPLPDGLRVAAVRENPDKPDSTVPYLVGGRLQTLLYMAQLGVISQDPWFSTLPDVGTADLAALDLDPMPEASFDRVLDVTCWLHDELDRLGVPCFAKTSGSEGLHVFIPLPPGTPCEAGMIFCQIVATVVAAAHPAAATVERTVRRRRADAVYVDYLQNVYGKTLACAYSARASPFAGVSTPLTWTEVREGAAAGLRPRDFTMRSIFPRLEQVGDLWAELRTVEPARLEAAFAYEQ